MESNAEIIVRIMEWYFQTQKLKDINFNNKSDFVATFTDNVSDLDIKQRFPTFFCSRTHTKKKNSHTPL